MRSETRPSTSKVKKGGPGVEANAKHTVIMITEPFPRSLSAIAGLLPAMLAVGTVDIVPHNYNTSTECDFQLP